MENYYDAISGAFDEFMLFDDVAPYGGGHHLDHSSFSREEGECGHHLDHSSFSREEGELAAFHNVSGGGGGGASFSSTYDEDEAAPGDQGGESSNCELAARKGVRRDRSKTLISERKRRVRMKETLYELRSIVPTISKMDKASIIADAVAYVKELQSQAQKLEEEINLLESSTSSSPSKGDRTTDEIVPRRKEEEKTMKSKKLLIMQVNAFDVGAGKFYVKVAGTTGDGTAAASSSLYAAVESLSCIKLESSNLVVDGEGFVFTVTILSKAEMMSSAAMELWVMGALLQQGFRFMQTAFSY